MSKKEIQNRLNRFPQTRYTHEERLAIERVCANTKKYNYSDLHKIIFRISLQNARSNELSPRDKDYLKYLESL